jgi:hypothetical protein
VAYFRSRERSPELTGPVTVKVTTHAARVQGNGEVDGPRFAVGTRSGQQLAAYRGERLLTRLEAETTRNCTARAELSSGATCWPAFTLPPEPNKHTSCFGTRIPYIPDA